MVDFVPQLLRWYEENQRNLPWRGESSPYKIWVSEIILQQTRVKQGWDYYLRFIEKFPDIESLANATEEEVLKVWQGLGYYSRARNLHASAQQIINLHNGVFPNSYNEIRKLKGIGDYTAAAIAAIAFNLPQVAVDGNVLRVISRMYVLFDDISLQSSKIRVREICQHLLKKYPPADFNQALMEFGALLCLPSNPLCENCPFSHFCYAFIHEKSKILPIKIKKIKIKKRYFHFLFFIDNYHNTIIQKRKEKDIWHNLFQFPLVETLNSSFSINNYLQINNIQPTSAPIKLKELQQQLSHQTIFANFFLISVKNIHSINNIIGSVIKIEELSKFPVPKLMTSIIDTL